MRAGDAPGGRGGRDAKRPRSCPSDAAPPPIDAPADAGLDAPPPTDAGPPPSDEFLALFETGRFDLRQSITLARVSLEWLTEGQDQIISP